MWEQNKQAILTLQSPAEGWKTKAQIFYVMAKKNAKENGSFLRTRKHVQIESKLIQVIVKKKKKTKKGKINMIWTLSFYSSVWLHLTCVDCAQNKPILLSTAAFQPMDALPSALQRGLRGGNQGQKIQL